MNAYEIYFLLGSMLIWLFYLIISYIRLRIDTNKEFGKRKLSSAK